MSRAGGRFAKALRNTTRDSISMRLPGVEVLSPLEIMSDLKELEGSDNDSVKSYDVLPSHYPVKPRKALQGAKPAPPARKAEKEIAHEVLEEAFLFMKKVSSEHKELFEAENRREELETICRSFEAQATQKKKTFAQQKPDFESYFRALQGLLQRSLRVRAERSKLNKMYLHIFDKLVEQKEEVQDLDRLIERVRGLEESKEPKEADIVHVRGLPDKNESVAIFVGQLFETPFGRSRVLSLDLDRKELELETPNGKVVASFIDVVQWQPVEEEHSLADLNKACEEIKDIINMSPNNLLRVKQLLELQIEDAEENTDADENSSHHSGSVLMDEDTSADESHRDEPIQHKSTRLASSIEQNNAARAMYPLMPAQAVTARRGLLAEELLNSDEVQSLSLALALAPIEALPSLLRDRWPPKFDDQWLFFDPETLDSSCILDDQIDSSSLLGWRGDTQELRAQLKEMESVQRQLETDQQEIAKKIVGLRSESGRVSANTSKLRLGIFTKRIAHRNFLGSHGIVINAVPIAGPTKTEEKQTSRSNRSKQKVPEDHEAPSSSSRAHETNVQQTRRGTRLSESTNGERRARVKEEPSKSESNSLISKRSRATDEKGKDDGNESADEHHSKRKPKRRRF